MKQIKYFLAANSCDGFVSYFDTCFEPKNDWKAFVIKGGPGTGKSSFMKKIPNAAEETGYTVHRCPCSSDPDSLDAVVIPKLKVSVLDGTAPHVIDPQYPGAVESILNFGDFWDTAKLVQKRKEIIKLTDKNKELHKTASAFLKSAGTLLKENRSINEKQVNTEKAEGYAKLLCKKYIKEKGSCGGETVRFLSAVSPKGIVKFEETVSALCDKTVIISDDTGIVSSLIFDIVRQNALEKKLKIITVKNPFLPKITEHILIPELGVAFLRESKYFPLKTDSRRIHAKRFMDTAESSIKVKNNTKTAGMLIDFAVSTLKNAKAVHDELEENFINAMDYEKINRFTQKFCDGLF